MTRKPGPDRGYTIIYENLPVQPGDRCPLCSVPPVTRCVSMNSRTGKFDTTAMCEPHLRAFMWKHYGPYLALVGDP